MDKELLDKGIAESTECLAEIIKRAFEKSASGLIKGYLTLDSEHSVIQKKDVRKICRSGQESCLPVRRGSIICYEPDERIWTATSILVSYVVRNNLVERFKDYAFKDFSIRPECFTEYSYREKKFLKYRKTGYDLTFLQVNIEW